MDATDSGSYGTYSCLSVDVNVMCIWQLGSHGCVDLTFDVSTLVAIARMLRGACTNAVYAPLTEILPAGEWVPDRNVCTLHTEPRWAQAGHMRSADYDGR